MKKILLAALLATIGTAQAGVYTFSMVDTSNNIFSGSFEGKAQGNLITDLSKISVAVNGVKLGSQSRPLFSAYLGQSNWTTGGQVSFDGLENNFLFINSDYGNGDTGYSAYLYSLSGFSRYGYTYNESFAYSRNGNFQLLMSGSPASYGWQVSAVNEVPEPGSLALIGLGIAGLAALRRRPK